MEVIVNVHHIPDIIANPYLIIDNDGLTLIDTGLSGSEKKILNYINGLGRSPGDLKRIVITHSDLDHIGGCLPSRKQLAHAPMPVRSKQKQSPAVNLRVRSNPDLQCAESYFPSWAYG